MSAAAEDSAAEPATPGAPSGMAAGPRPGWVIALVCVPVFVGALDLTVVSAVLLHMLFDLEVPLQTGLDDAAWIVSGYLLAYTVAMTFMGRLSDLYGRRRVYVIALLIFTLGSVLVAVADDAPARWVGQVYRLVAGRRPDPALMALWAVIGGRVVQAFGAGALVPVSMALVGDLYPPGRRAGPLGVIGAVDTAGWVVGHLYGGIMVSVFDDWRILFWVNVPVCVLALALTLWALRRVPQERAPGSFDAPGALLISGALIALNVALGGQNELSATSAFGTQAPPTIDGPLLGLALALLAAFIVVESRQVYPLLPLGLFRDRNFAAACVANFLIGISLVIAIANVPLFINSLVATSLEQGAWDSGWMLSGLTLPMALAAPLGGWLVARRGYRAPTLAGLALAIAGFALMSTWRAATPYALMLGHLALAGVGLGLIIAPVATAVLNAAGQAQRGVAAALVIILRLCGMSLGIAALTLYGLQRSAALNAALQAGGPLDPGRLAELGLAVANQVINETFALAALVCGLALLPALLLRRERPDRIVMH